MTLKEFIKHRITIWTTVIGLFSLMLTVIGQWEGLGFRWFISDHAVAQEIAIVDAKFTTITDDQEAELIRVAGEQQDYSKRNEMQILYMRAENVRGKLGEVRYKRGQHDNIDLARKEASLEGELRNLDRQICYLEGRIDCRS